MENGSPQFCCVVKCLQWVFFPEQFIRGQCLPHTSVQTETSPKPEYEGRGREADVEPLEPEQLQGTVSCLIDLRFPE